MASRRKQKQARQLAAQEAAEAGPQQYRQLPPRQYFLQESTRVEPDLAKWQTIWPNYINGRKARDEGRRLVKDKCCDDPFPSDIAEVCQHFKLDCCIEAYKMYPRDWIQYPPGRVRVRLLKDDGTPSNPDMTNKKALLIACGELIPKLASRKQRIKMAEEHAKRQQQAQSAAANAAAAGSGGGGGGGGGKRKGKKKGRR
eukprot:g5269.t1